jgi:hypothetical protein
MARAPISNAGRDGTFLEKGDDPVKSATREVGPGHNLDTRTLQGRRPFQNFAISHPRLNANLSGTTEVSGRSCQSSPRPQKAKSEVVTPKAASDYGWNRLQLSQTAHHLES